MKWDSYNGPCQAAPLSRSNVLCLFLYLKESNLKQNKQNNTHHNILPIIEAFMSVSLSVPLLICPSVNMSLFQYVQLSICLSVHLSNCPPVHMSVHPSLCPSLRSSIGLSVRDIGSVGLFGYLWPHKMSEVDYLGH